MNHFTPGIVVTTGQPDAETFAALDKATHEWEMRAARGECAWICSSCCSHFAEGMPGECPHNVKDCTEIIQRDKCHARRLAMNEELKPCPFCGGKPSLKYKGKCGPGPELDSVIKAECPCGAAIESRHYAGHNEEARTHAVIQKWNRRPEPDASRPVAWAAFAENGNIRIWTGDAEQASAIGQATGLRMLPLGIIAGSNHEDTGESHDQPAA